MAAKKSKPEGVLVKVYLDEGIHRRLKAQAAFTGRQIGEEAAELLDTHLPVNVFATAKEAKPTKQTRQK